MHQPSRSADTQRLRLATLNIAHGRGQRGHQLFTSSESIDDHLAAIAAFLQRQNVTIAALQEVDHLAWWTGHLDMSQLIAQRASFGWSVAGQHVDGLGLGYGTATLSTAPITDVSVITFPARWGTPGKGMTTGTVHLSPDRQLSVVNVHLHYAPGAIQNEQAEALIRHVNGLPRPVIVAGDLNSGWSPGLVAEITTRCGLSAWQPHSNQPTLRGSERRIDWILISEPLQWVDVTTTSNLPSDHAGVIAEVLWPAGN